MMCSDEDLDLVECAIHRVLKQEVDAQTQNRSKFDAQAQQASESDAENVPESEISAEHADAGDGVDTRNITLLSRLIEEVHAMRMKKASEQKFDDKPVEQEPSVQKGKESTNPADAVVKVAVAAADAAQAAAASVAKNSEIIEVLLETVRIRRQEMDLDEEEDEDDSHAHTKAAKKISEKKTVFKIVKELQRQNIFTHVILGLMVVTTAYWRFKEISWILRLRKMMSNPLEAVGGIFGGDPQPQKYSDKEEVETKTLQLPKLELPKILQMNENEEKTTSP